MTTASIFIASIFCTVSLKLSPFFKLLEEAEKLTVSALRRFCANSKLILVRVEFSKKRFTIVLPCKEGTFFIGLSSISLKLKDVSIILSISLAGKFSKPRRCFCFIMIYLIGYVL